jgi:hypothetical protein
MLTSQLIARLQELQDTHGDLPVSILPEWYDVVTGASVQDVPLEPYGDTAVKAVVLKTSIDDLTPNQKP